MVSKSHKESDRKYSVLFVDDEKRVTRALKSIFRKEYLVYIANSGEEALKILAENEIDVIVSDQRMPNMLGHELLAQVEKLHPRIMRILLTGYTDKEAIINNINEGQVYRFLNKPWNHDDIQRVVAEAAIASEFEVRGAVQEIEVLSSKAAFKRPAVHIIESFNDIKTMLEGLDIMKGSRVTVSDNFEDALKIIDNNIFYGVLIFKTQKNVPETIQFISMLKQKRPELQTIVVAEDSDSDYISQLINVGQVFRYFSNPCDPLVLEDSIEMAFKSYTFLWQQKKAQARVNVEQKSLIFSSKMKNIFSRFGLRKSEQEA